MGELIAPSPSATTPASCTQGGGGIPASEVASYTALVVTISVFTCILVLFGLWYFAVDKEQEEDLHQAPLSGSGPANSFSLRSKGGMVVAASAVQPQKIRSVKGRGSRQNFPAPTNVTDGLASLTMTRGQQDMLENVFLGTVLNKSHEQYKLNFEDLTFICVVGQGTFGDCYKGFYRGNELCAIKKMRVHLLDKEGIQAFAREVKVLSSINHANIVSFIGFLVDPAVLIVMEFVGGGTLSAWIKALRKSNKMPSAAQCMGILLDVANGMHYLHTRKPQPIMHRDLKTDNVLLATDNEMKSKVADLGEASFDERESERGLCGTQGYVAPEILRGHAYGCAVDIYSFAIVAAELLTLNPPYYELRGTGDAKGGDNDGGGGGSDDVDEIDSNDDNYTDGGVVPWQTINERICTSDLRPELPDATQLDLRKLVEEMWDADPKRRPPFEMIVFRLQQIASLFTDVERATGASRQVALKLEKQDAALKFCNAFNAHLWALLHRAERANEASGGGKEVMKSRGHQLDLFTNSFTASASDDILNQTLKGLKGAACVESLVALFFEIRGAFVARPEPLLPDDVHMSKNGTKICYQMKFVIEKRQPTKDQMAKMDEVEESGSSWDEMASVALSSKSETLLFTNVRKKSAAQVRKASVTVPEKNIASLKMMESSRRVKKKTNLVKKDAGGRAILRYLQAARYFRENACSMVHPTGKLKLYGLMMQICCGDYSEKGADILIVDSDARDDAVGMEIRKKNEVRSRLHELKKAAWERERGKTQEDCAKEYVEMITQLIPNWRADRLFRMRDDLSENTHGHRKKKEELSWTLRFDTVVDLGNTDNQDRLKIKAKHVHIMQSDSSLRDSDEWVVDFRTSFAKKRKPKRRLTAIQCEDAKKRGIAPWVLESLTFSEIFAGLSRQKLILDRQKHLRLKDQDSYFFDEMVAHANSTDGWNAADLSTLSGAVESRPIPDSTRLQYRTRAKVRARATDLNKFLDSEINGLKTVTLMTLFTDPESEKDLDEDWCAISRTLEHVVFELPWPLSAHEDIVLKLDMSKRIEPRSMDSGSCNDSDASLTPFWLDRAGSGKDSSRSLTRPGRGSNKSHKSTNSNSGVGKVPIRGRLTQRVVMWHSFPTKTRWKRQGRSRGKVLYTGVVVEPLLLCYTVTCLQNIVLDDAVPLSVCEDVWAKLFLRIPIRCFRHYFKKSVQENSTKMMIERHAPQNRQKSTKSMSVFISRKAHGSFRDSIKDHEVGTSTQMNEFEEAERAQSMKRGRSSRQLSMLAKDEEVEGLSDDVVKNHQIQTLRRKLEQERKQKEEVKKIAQDLGRRLSTHEPLQLDKDMKDILELQATLAVPVIEEGEDDSDEEDTSEDWVTPPP